jgi:quercetin dioxygenase-like cupin family protein
MKRSMYLILAIGLLCGAGLTFAAQVNSHESHESHVFTPDTIPWGPAPPFVAPGAQLAVLEGNPGAASGDYTVRVKMPDGYRIAPHWHPLRENVTVISGTFKVGMGDVFETNKMTALPAGSFAFLDPDMHHYAMAYGQVVVQIHGMAPLQFNYVNPGDDPSKSK